MLFCRKKFDFLVSGIMVMIFTLTFSCVNAPESEEDSTPQAAYMKTETVTVSSDYLLAGSAINSADKTVTVITPPTYIAGTKKYPVVYLLAGFGETTQEFISEFGASGLWDAMKQKKMAESIMVIIDARTVVSCSFYADSKVLGNWEKFIAHDVVGKIDTLYRTLPQAESRGINGYATGGTGAFTIAMKYPDVFSSVYIFNAGITDETGVYDYILGNEGSIKSTINIVDGFKDASTDAVISKLRTYDLYSEMNIRLCYGLSYASLEDAPHISFPYMFDLNNTVVRDDSLYAAWQSGFGGIEEKITTYKENLNKLSGIVIEYGTAEENDFIINGSKYYANKLKTAGISCELRTNSGGHINYTVMKERYKSAVFPYFNSKLFRE